MAHVADPLNQADIDALLASVRQAQRDVGAQTGAQAAEPQAVGADVAPNTAAFLRNLLATAWAPFGAEGVAHGTGPGELRGATRAVRLAAPWNGRLWFFWEGAGPHRREAAERFLRVLRDRAAPGECQEVDPNLPLPATAAILPFEMTLGGQIRQLTLAMDPAVLATVERAPGEIRPGTADQLSDGARGGAGVPVQALEVEAAVYVGGGLYPLSSLSTLRPGTLLPLDTAVGQEAILAIGGRVVGYGEIVVTPQDELALRLTRVVLGEEGRHLAPPWLQHAHPAPRRGTQG